jgi:transcription-repair coupling factor (superfamily II helicase)
MEIHDIAKLYAMLPQVGALRHVLENKSEKDVFLEGLVGSSQPLLFAALSQKEKKKPLPSSFLFVLPDADEAGYFYSDLMQLENLPKEGGESAGAAAQVLFFPSSYRRAVKYGQRDAANEILRTEVLARLNTSLSTSQRLNLSTSQPLNVSARPEGALSERSGERTSQPLNTSLSSLHSPLSSLYIVTYPEALAELVASQKTIDDHLIQLTTGQTTDIVELEHRLRELGFHEEDYVYEPGQFAVRGSILDVYSFSHELPFRIDFFGDEIDSIRTFEVEDQLSKERCQSVEIVPELAAAQAEKVSFLEVLPDDCVLVAKDLSFVSDTVKRIYEEGFSSQAVTERLETATEMEREQLMNDMRRELQLARPTQFQEQLSQFRHIILRGERRVESGEWKKENGERRVERGERNVTITFHTVGQPLFHKNVELLKRSVSDYQLQGYKLYILADSQKQHQRLQELITSPDPSTHQDPSDLYTLSARPSSPSGRSGEVLIPVDHTLHEGFVDHDLKACFFTDHQIFDRFHKFTLKNEKARSGKMALTMKELQELEIGDYLVHVDYGIGKFGGLVRIPIGANAGANRGEAYQEVIRIIYQHNDKVDVSIHSLYKISKYRRSDTGEPPRLSILGSGAWDRMKERTKKRIKDIARDLIRLYARRQKEKGFAYSPDSYLQNELEASFLYEDTPDQLRATQEVKADMEASKPMDRLVCGDVGFGKTEVAIRAAFKAAADSKQVAVMVPTTVLAFQHYQTFRDRLKGMPVRVEYLSRARSAKKTKEILTDLAEGKIDILIGTHKLIGKQVKWKDLGLLIIDEEQKFGVSVKEKLRQLKANVDTLTMSATPIPRTLQFSLMGARDMSIIRTPPPNRYPIYTELGTYGSDLIADAINYEMSRNGQVFFVNDRISNLEEIKRLIMKNVPDCRVAIGHGQMKPEELERVIMDFINYDYDVLLSTTIVENGIDIPNANTIIINDAHRFGLSDLHQMRGRVGRSNRKAFCYLLAPPKSVLTPEARRRLEALETFSELGSGFNLAMQDLDIRGAGNLLGAEQSGFMEDLGYETYLKIIKQAMAELRNETPPSLPEGEEGLAVSVSGSNSHVNRLPSGRPSPPSEGSGEVFIADCTVESDLAMYFPDTYVPGSSERMLLYRELDAIEDDRSLQAYRKRLEDRFGPVPHEGEELMQVVMLRRIGKRLGCEKITLRQGLMIMQFVSNGDSPYYQSQTFTRVINYATSPANIRRCLLKEVATRGTTATGSRRLMHVRNVPTVGEAVRVLRAIENLPLTPPKEGRA